MPGGLGRSCGFHPDLNENGRTYLDGKQGRGRGGRRREGGEGEREGGRGKLEMGRNFGVYVHWLFVKIRKPKRPTMP